MWSERRCHWAVALHSPIFPNMSQKYFNPKCKKVQRLFTFLRLPMSNRMTIELFSLLNRRLRLRSFVRRVFRILLYKLCLDRCCHRHRLFYGLESWGGIMEWTIGLERRQIELQKFLSHLQFEFI